MLNVAVCLFTLTCSHRPIFICFVTVATFLVALDALICGLLFSKCSAKNLWLSSLNWALNRQYGLVAKPFGKSASNSINTSAFLGTNPVDKSITVAVGTLITERPPHRSVRARLRIRLLRRMSGVEARIGIGVQNAGRRNPPVQDWGKTFPAHLCALAAADQNTLP